MNIAEEIAELKNTVEEILRDARVDYETTEAMMDGGPEEHYSSALLAVVNALDELSFSAAEQEAVNVNESADEREDWIDPNNAHEHVWVPASVTRALWNAGHLTAAQGLDLFELFDLVEDMADSEPGAGASLEDRTIELWRERIRETVSADA